MPSEILKTRSLHNSCRAVWVCKRCGNCARHCKHDDPANFHEDLNLPCSGPCQCIDCVSVDEPVNVELFRIKPLEWRNHRYDYQEFYSARGLLGEYIVIRWIDLNKHEWGEWKLKRQHETGVYAAVASPEEGRQLAEQHWQEYIKQALVPVETEQ